MRFAYIDSQGNEVPIPSVDALALRIELGAIGPDTELYDSQADRWGPAHTHEIFHTLSREAEDEGFVAPPPPVAPADEEEGGEEAAEAAEEPAAEPEAEDDDLGFDVADGLELVDEEEGGEEAAAVEEPATGDEGEEDAAMNFGLTEAPAAEEAEESAVTAEAGPDEAGDEEGFDFGGVDALELEEGAEEEEEEPLPEPPQEEPAGADDGGLDLEQPLSEMGASDLAGGDEGTSGGLELEQPMSEFEADGPPSWMEQDGPEGDDDAMDFSSGAAGEEEEEEDAAPAPAPAATGAEEEEEEEGEEEPPRERRSRPSPPRRPKKTSPVKLIVGVVALAAIGGGGWFGWQALQSGGGSQAEEPETPVLPAVTIPDIPAELLPVMRDLGEEALSEMIAELRGMQGEFDLLDQPREDWLAGIYLANASDYPEVEEYWVALESYVDRVRDVDTQVFHENYLEQLEAAEITGDTAAILIERADSGFLATRGDRLEAYNQMDDLINASLDLHDFLLRNEEQIEHEPAAGGVSRDPVLEAVPATDEIGDQMWDMVDRITSALDALGTLDRVTTERLLAVLFDRIRRASFE